MAAVASPGPPSGAGTRPLILINRLPRHQLSALFPFLQTRYRILDPIDESGPSFATLSKSGRVMLCVGTTPLTSDTLDRYPSLECVVCSSAGHEPTTMSTSPSADAEESASPAPETLSPMTWPISPSGS
ncbi:unnamed protein product [Cuscuta campestris]|uniref:D-isomer specific 2-hydroxyacid dehydrogenase catalytic domain-containing protein n=1 Tax=Cuscuta campestris TaxID=132261 RepID=A0A484LKN8_9ASTE|nr:unnamed protein product [Cuscuta campestris]